MWPWFSPKQCKHPSLKRYQEALPKPQSLARTERYLALDFETTGLNAHTHHIVSAGWVKIEQERIELQSARYHLIASSHSLEQSPTIHGLHKADLIQGSALSSVLEQLYQEAAGYTLLCHYHPLELNFLRQASLSCFQESPELHFIDTLKLERVQFQNAGRPFQSKALQLSQCLTRHNLPSLNQHQALCDAYGCATLFLAQLKKLSKHTTLGSLLKRSR